MTFTATTTSGEGVPTGTITFMDGSATLGTGTLNASGQATLTTSALGLGSHSITAVYGGSSTFSSSTSSAVTQIVNQNQLVAPTVTFTGAPSSAPYRSSFAVAATTNASTTAVITASGACTILGNTVTMTSGTGTCSLTASWAADSNYAAATASQSTTATKITPTVSFTGAPASAVMGPSSRSRQRPMPPRKRR